MKVIALEIRDKGTFIPVLGIMITPENVEQRYLLRRCGFWDEGRDVVLLKIADQHAAADLYDWGDRTMQTAHNWIRENWDSLKDGDVVDVEFILGESKVPKLSERFTTSL